MAARKDLLRYYLVLGLAATLIYAKSLHTPYFIFDDAALIFENPQIQSFSLQSLKNIWSSSLMPVPLTYWGMLGSLTSAPEPWVFRAAGLIIHWLNSILVLHLLLRWPSQTEKAPQSGLACLIGALFFALHPTGVETVTWIAASKDLLASFFALLSIHFFLDLRTPDGFKKRPQMVSILWLIASLVLAALSKVNSLAILLAFLWWDILLFKTRRRRILAWHGPLMMLLGAAFVFYRHRLVPQSWVPDFSILLTLPAAASSILLSLQKLTASGTFYFDYGVTPHLLLSTLGGSELGLGIAALISVLAIGSLFAWSRIPWLEPYSWGIALAVILLFPTSGALAFKFQNYSTVADRYLYLPSVGIAMVVARLSLHAIGARRRAIWLFMIIGCLCTWAALAYRQTGLWRDSRTLLEHTLKHNPRSQLAHEGLAVLDDQLPNGEGAQQAEIHRALSRAIQKSR